jgi:hypothetical protein
MGAAYLYTNRDDRTVVNSTVNGTFSGAYTHLLSCSLTYLF